MEENWLSNVASVAFPRLFRVAKSKEAIIRQCWLASLNGWNLQFRRNLVDAEIEECTLPNLLCSLIVNDSEDKKIWLLEGRGIFHVSSLVPKLLAKQAGVSCVN